MPSQDGVGGDNRRDMPQDLATKQLALRDQAAALVVGQADASFPDLLPQDAVFFLEVINDVLLVLVDPAGECCKQDMPGA
jgi:hypothetical protein